jgi:hypothetical protein
MLYKEFGSSAKSLMDEMFDIHTAYVYLLFPALASVGYILVFYLNLPWTVVFLGYAAIPKLDQIFKGDWINPTRE